MNNDRRRAQRYGALEEIGVIHDSGQDRPATLMDFSSTGVLVNLLTLAGVSQCNASVNDLLGLSFQCEESQFHVQVRVVRKGPQFLAVEFVDGRADATEMIDKKIQHLAMLAGMSTAAPPGPSTP